MPRRPGKHPAAWVRVRLADWTDHLSFGAGDSHARPVKKASFVECGGLPPPLSWTGPPCPFRTPGRVLSRERNPSAARVATSRVAARFSAPCASVLCRPLGTRPSTGLRMKESATTPWFYLSALNFASRMKNVGSASIEAIEVRSGQSTIVCDPVA